MWRASGAGHGYGSSLEPERKTWLIPSQLCIGLVMIFLAFSLDSLLYVRSPSEDLKQVAKVEHPHINSLTCYFFLLYFLCATQEAKKMKPVAAVRTSLSTAGPWLSCARRM